MKRITRTLHSMETHAGFYKFPDNQHDKAMIRLAEKMKTMTCDEMKAKMVSMSENIKQMEQSAYGDSDWAIIDSVCDQLSFMKKGHALKCNPAKN